MEVGGGGVGGRRRLSSRETSPDRARLMGYSQHHHHHHQRFIRPLRKVQIIYYLSRNGQLEHPHFMELPYLPNQHLRLKDVTERLTLLRGKGMPSLFSWSCKRSYKNGYVWNDLAENDIIYPADGIEYVLKGSEIIPGTYERYQHLPAGNRKPKALPVGHHNSGRQQHVDFEDDEEEGEIEEEVEEVIEDEEVKCVGHAAGNMNKVPNCYTCSRGVSTDELGRVKNRARTPRSQDLHRHSPTELPLDDASPPSSSSSDKPPAAVTVGDGSGGSSSQRFEDGDPVTEPGLSRNSVLLHLISCGSGAVKGGRSGGTSGAGAGSLLKSAACAVVAASPLGGGRRSSGGLQRGLVSRLASRAVLEEDELRCVSENLRFGHPLLEDKEYFSGSIVEGNRCPPEPSLKKSSSYNEERSSKLGIEEVVKLETREEREGGVKAKCIPGRRKASGSKQQQQQTKKGS